MIRSMTGFGKAEYKYTTGKITVELKSVNHRFFELSPRMPSGISFLEDKVRSYINTKIKRGKVNLNIAIEGNHILDKSLTINKPLAKKYHALLSALKKELGMERGVSLDYLLSMPEVLISHCAVADSEKVWQHIKIALDKAVDNLISAREAEGAALCKDMRKRAQAISKVTDEIKAQAPLVVKKYKENLKEKIAQISPSVKLDEGRLEQEVTIFAKNCDITEEIVRLKAHINNFDHILSSAKEAGRQLDFTAQELFREINTIGSKAQDVNISKRVIQVKEEIEKIREQVQNVE